jgi:DNA-binding protein HU-beta
LNKTDLVEKIVKATKLTKKDSDKALTAIIGAISGALAKGEKVQLVGFGSFEVRKRAARKGRNPQTGKEISIAARKVPVFKAGKALKDAVGKK